MLTVIPFYYATSDSSNTSVQMPPERTPAPPVKEPIDEPPLEKSESPNKHKETPLI